MIKNPYARLTTVFVDWDDSIIGILRTPRSLKDQRYLINFFCDHNLVAPDLRASQFTGAVDPYAAERAELRRRAKRDYPRRRVYPVETIIPELTPDGSQMLWREDGTLRVAYHALEFVPAEYVRRRPGEGKSFRPQKEA